LFIIVSDVVDETATVVRSAQLKQAIPADTQEITAVFQS
jgi:hypothetical protein